MSHHWLLYQHIGISHLADTIKDIAKPRKLNNDRILWYQSAKPRFTSHALDDMSPKIVGPRYRSTLQKTTFRYGTCSNARPHPSPTPVLADWVLDHQ